MTHSETFNYLYGNRVAIETGLIFLVTAAIKTAPMPGKPINWYEWFYDCSHQIFNITNTRLTNQSIPIAPENSPAPKP